LAETVSVSSKTVSVFPRFTKVWRKSYQFSAKLFQFSPEKIFFGENCNSFGKNVKSLLDTEYSGLGCKKGVEGNPDSTLPGLGGRRVFRGETGRSVFIGR
jgi:hypothetical protein